MRCTSEEESVSVKIKDNCRVEVFVNSPQACPLFKATSFGIFMTHWPLIMAICLTGMGLLSTFYGFKYFKIVVIFTFMTVSFFGTMVVLSKVGMMHFLEKNLSKVHIAHVLFFICVGILSVGFGGLLGYYVDERIGLVTICVLNVGIVSTAFYMFLLSFTGLW